MIKLGDKVKDKITGFKGVAFARCEYLGGCVNIEIMSQTLGKEGKTISEWFDEALVEVTRSGKAKCSKPTGGPREAPPGRSHPTR